MAKKKVPGVPFKKGDPRINRKGAPKKSVRLKELMTEMLGLREGQDIKDSPLGKVVKALLDESLKSNSPLKVQAAKELMDRVFGKPKIGEDEDGDNDKPLVWNETKTYKK